MTLKELLKGTEWWKSSTPIELEAVHDDMECLGVPSNCAADFIDRVITVIREEYGE